MIKIHIFLLIVGLFSLDASAIAQVGRAGAGGFPGSVGGRSGLGGPQQRFSPRAVNPNFNPRGSLSTYQNLNPRGSLSPALNLNPQGSLLRPRTSGVTGFNNGSVATSARVTAYKIPFAPNYSQLRILPRSSVSSWAKISLQQFESSLSEYKNAEAWRTYLDLDKIESRLETATDQPLDEPSREQLANVLDRFATVATDIKYKKVKLLPGFRATWTSLRELLRADSGDERERLIRSVTALNRELKDQEGGKALQEDLALPELIEADSASNADSPTAFRAACEKTSAGFEKITATGGDRRITDLSEFQATAENLRSLLQKMQQPQVVPSAVEALKLTDDPTDASPLPSTVATDEQPAAGGQKLIPAGEVGDGSDTSATDPARPDKPLGERLLYSVVDLDRQLEKVAPNSEWPKRLSLDKLRGVVSVSSERPRSDSERKAVMGILDTYQTIAKNDEDDVVNTLPEFKKTLNALQEYLGR